MGGSKKGERRGNARKRPGKRDRTHETPGEIMRDAVSRRGGPAHLNPVVIERRIQVARIINGLSDSVDDITPKEAMLMGMRHSLQAVKDFTMMLEALSELPVTEDTTARINVLDAEIERLWDKAGEFAFKCAGYIHPKLQAIATNADLGQNQASILRELFDDIDERERSNVIPIEFKPKAGG
jgi:hypothetical protein